jgi:hypothetical protein
MLLDVSGSVMEHPSCKHSLLPRVIRVGAGDRLIGHHLRSDHDGGLRVKERHLLGDGGPVPMDERDQLPGCDQHLFAFRCFPEDLSVECLGPHVQPPVVAQGARVGQSEGFVVHEERDDLAVRHVHHGLAGLREAVGFLCVHHGPGFIEPVDEGAVFGVGHTFPGQSRMPR